VAYRADRVAFQRLTNWLANRAAADDPARRDMDAWLPLIKQLHQLRNPRPRLRTTAQQFMANHPDVVKAAFVSKHGDGKNYNSAQKMNLHSEIARKTVAGLSSNSVKELGREATESHERELSEWNLSMTNVFEAEDVSLYAHSIFRPRTSPVYILVLQRP
jgi:hypothetical protein